MGNKIIMGNNDILKKLRVALQLRDEQIVEILQLVDFRVSKGEIGNFFRSEDHPKYVVCKDQILRNFLNGLVIYLRGTKEQPKNPMDVLKSNKAKAIKSNSGKKELEGLRKKEGKTPIDFNPAKAIRFNNGKKKLTK